MTSIFTKYGYKPYASGLFRHKEGHTLSKTSNGWKHVSVSGKQQTGKDESDLEGFLSKHHGSQHSEEPEVDDWHKDFHISEDQAKEIIAEKYGK